MRKLFLAAFWLSLVVGFVSAQGISPSGWPIEERCVRLPTEPPDDWSFGGVILATGRWGLHGIRAELETPYVIVFGLGNSFSLSPDNRLFATAVGDRSPSNQSMWVDDINIYRLRVFDTGSGEPVYSSEWSLHFSDHFSALYDDVQIRWFDNDHLIYRNENGVVLVNPFTGEIEDWERGLYPLRHLALLYPSPDWTYALYDTTADIATLDFHVRLYDVATEAAVSDLIGYQEPMAWRPASEDFIANYTYRDKTATAWHHVLRLIEVPDNVQSEIINTTDGINFGVNAWSPDGQYFAFTTTSDRDMPSRLLIADVRNRALLDPCLLTVTGYGYTTSWSPDGRMLAFNGPREGEDYEYPLPVQVLDLDTRRAYTVAYHNGVIIGWRD